ncbi:gastrin/cholecystokinin type B receptor-like [Saccostrea echinata]|uniref:gastrin/cholecystokinin type B receptor-like n=1 Tax=Saccostrea echinata TaxID=191078 RepID=UPI002A8056E9|nr:gastrin/cholecystokinin type B receptor-like [Saccostrea echinata]
MNVTVNITNNDKSLKSYDFSIFARLCGHTGQSTNSSNDSFILRLQSICNSPLYSITIDRKNILPTPLPKSTVEVFMVLYLLIIILAVFGNSLVLGFIGVVKKARTLTDIYIVSLASSDLLIAALNMPFQLYYVVANDWVASGNFGLFLCKFTTYIEGVTVVASILTLLFIAIDRYAVICEIGIANVIHNRSSGRIIVIALWCISLCVPSPNLIFQKLDKRVNVKNTDGVLLMDGFKYICVEFFPNKYSSRIYTAMIYTCFYLLPVLVIAFSYGRIGHRLWIHHPIGDVLENPRHHERNIKQKKRVIKMLVMLFLSFTLLWLPFFTFHLYREFVVNENESFRMKSAILKLIGYANCCVNPIIYTFLNKAFQNEFIRLFCKNRVFVTSMNGKTEMVRITKL